MSSDLEYTDRISSIDDPCPECGDELVDEEIEIYCSGCGAVVDDAPVDPGPEWRSFPGEKNESSRGVGSMILESRHDRGIGTAPTNFFSDEYSAKNFRLSRLDKGSKYSSKRERNVARGFQEIRRMSSALGLDKQLDETASRIFRQASKQGLLRGRAIESIASAALLAAAKIHKRPITIEDVRQVSRISPNITIRSAYRTLDRDLELPIPPSRPIEFLPRVIDGLELQDDRRGELRQEAREIAIDVEENALIHGSPTGIAAGIVDYVAKRRGFPVTQFDLEDAIDVTPSTIRKNRDKVIEWLESEGSV